jgi:hypothetical protein
VKVRSLEELEDGLDKDLSWRKHEISLITGLIQKAKGPKEKTLIRAGIALMYSHWEGHIKKCAEIYLCYLNHLSHKYCDMKDNFAHLSLAEKFAEGFSIKKYKSQKEIFSYIESGLTSNFKVDEKKVIDTESNLKSEVFLNMIHQLGLDVSPFELKNNFIDKTMVKNRNSIAHGERVGDKELLDAYIDIEKELLVMIQTFQNMIRTAACNKSFLKETT